MANEPPAPALGTILEQLRAAVRERRLADGPNELSAVEQDVRRSLDEIELHRVISAHWPLKSRTPSERLINLLNKIVRRMLRWYINPIVEQQNAYNDAVARTLRLFADAYGELADQIRTQGQEPPSPPPAGPRSGAPLHDPSVGLSSPSPQQLVEHRGQHEPEARFVELALTAQAQQLALHERIHAHWPLVGATLPARLIALIQAATRRYLRWLINPIAEQQSNANAAISAAIHNLIRLDADRRADAAALRAARHHK